MPTSLDKHGATTCNEWLNLTRQFASFSLSARQFLNTDISQGSVATLTGVVGYLMTTLLQIYERVGQENTRGDQKVLQLGYKKLTYYLFAYFQLLFSAVYALKIEFSVLTLRPCLHNDLQRFIVYKSGSMKTVLHTSY